ncbi:MAG: hypothetical protein ISR76_10225 [Planctomycetes bacterium]|nr:hypothetical protein [Planctomycetota bacterium]
MSCLRAAGLALFIAAGTALVAWWIGSSPGELPVRFTGRRAPDRESSLEAAAAARGGEGRTRLPDQPAAGPPTDLLDQLHRREERGAALERALADPGLASWVLERLERVDFVSARHRELGWALRAVLTVWEDLPVAPPLERPDYLSRVVAAGARHDRAASAVAFAWSDQRLLAAEDLALVQSARPEQIDGLGSFEAGERRAAMFLALLEDVLGAHLDRGLDPVVLAYLGDPSAQVRMLARRLWFATERSGGWTAALAGIQELAREERLALMRQIAQQADLEQAVAALRLAEERFGEGQGFLPAWVDLGGREPEAVASVYAELLVSGRASVLPEGAYLVDPERDPGGFLELRDVFAEGRGRSNLLTAYLVTAENRGSVDWDLVEASSQREWNPLVRGTSWTALAGSGEADRVASAYQQLIDPDWRSSTRIPGVQNDSHLVPGLRELAQGLPVDALGEYRQALAGFRLAAEELAGLEQLLEGRRGSAGDM